MNKLNQFKGTRLTMVIMISIGLSIFLWARYKVSGSEEFQMDAEVVCNVSDPEKFTAFTCLTNTTEEINQVKLTVRCAKIDRAKVRPGDFALYLDFTAEKEQNVIPSLELKPSMAQYMGPSADKDKFTVMDVYPRRLRAVVDTIGDRSLPIRVDIKGTPGEGYAITQTNVSPSFITVKGPEELLSKMESLSTETLSVEGVNKDLDTLCSVVVPEKLNAHTRHVTVKLEISHEPKVVSLEKIAIARFGTPQGDKEVTFQPATVDLIMEVPVEDAEAFDPKSISPYVDVNNLAPADYTLPVKVLPPKVGNVKKIIPSEIEVSIQQKPKVPKAPKPAAPSKPEVSSKAD
ncbi:hypothetical protein IKW72_06825 [bacterium]|nr:hypothetical protein [bacterium]